MGIFDRVKQKVSDLSSAQNAHSFVVIDVEKTGLSPKSERIIEIALLEFMDGTVSKKFVSRFNPEGPVGATEIHGITADDVINAPKFAEKSGEILEFIQGKTLVAHNARFDLAFLRNELFFSGYDISWMPAICTFEASRYYFPHLERRKLLDCCNEAEIALNDAHSALGDATATGMLMNFYLSATKHPRPRHEDLILISNPATLEISRVEPRPFPKRRDPVVQEAIRRSQDKPKNTNSNQSYQALRLALKACSISAVLQTVLEPGIEEYLDKLVEFLEDGAISPEELNALAEVSQIYGLDSQKQTFAHEVFLLALAYQAVADETVSLLEREELSTIATLLGLSEKAAGIALKAAKAKKEETISRELPPLPDGWKLGEPLRVGDKVVFTGCDPNLRDSLESHAKKIGVAVSSSVTQKTKFLITDGSYVGNKANDAARLGTRIVTPEEFSLLLKFVQPAVVVDSKRNSGKSTQAGAEDLDPAEVRAWALSQGIEVSPKGRIHSEVYDAFKRR
jgi:DNA polymerase-3 subunit epsilon